MLNVQAEGVSITRRGKKRLAALMGKKRVRGDQKIGKPKAGSLLGEVPSATARKWPEAA